MPQQPDEGALRCLGFALGAEDAHPVGTGRIGIFERLPAGRLITYYQAVAKQVVQTMRQFTALIQRQGEGYVSLCPELDVASQGDTVEEAKRNLRIAVELFLNAASPAEIADRLEDEIYLTSVSVGAS